jgi:hypothetical protein
MPKPDGTETNAEYNERWFREQLDAAYVKFLHEYADWSPGCAGVARAAIEAGWYAAERAWNHRD